MDTNPSLWTVIKLWFFYFLPFVPAVPAIGMLSWIDCIFVQAFGRNTFPDEELGQRLLNFRLAVKSWPDEKRSADMPMFDALKQAGFDPGNANRALAYYAIRMAYRFNVPIIAQWEVVYAIYETDLKWYLDHCEQIDCLWPPDEGYFATAHVKLASREKMRARGKKRPLELAHPAMITRAVPIIWYTGVSPIVEEIRAGSVERHPLWVWDKNSVQPWTTSFDSWKTREFVGRIAHVVTHLPLTRHVIFAIKPKLSRAQQQMIPGNWLRFTPPKPA